jgi:hypothetical protein
MAITAVIPTRGDVDMTEIRRSLAIGGITEILIERCSSVYGRYELAARARNPIIYTQDDDCLTDVAEVISAYEPGIIVNAMTSNHSKQYRSQVTLLGFGSVFDQSLIKIMGAFKRDEVFLRECDRVFTALVPHKSVFPNVMILPHATAENRLYRQKEHEAMRREIGRRIDEYKRMMHETLINEN